MYEAVQDKPEILLMCLADKTGKIMTYHATTEGNWAEALERVLAAATPNQRLTVVYDEQFHLHYLSREKYTFAVIADSAYSRQLAFTLLREVEEFVDKEYVDEATNDELRMFLTQKCSYYNANQDLDKFTALKVHLEEVQQILLTNLEKALNRGEKAELLINRSKGIKSKAQAFRLQSKTVKHFMYVRKNPKQMLLIAAIIIVVVVVFLALYCEDESWHECFANIV